MKKHLLALLSSLALTVAAQAHGEVEIGPNGGRILEFSKNETLHGEVTLKDDKFSIELLDKDMKAVALDKQTLTATTGERDKPQKLTVEKVDGKFMVPAQKGDNYWLIFQYRDSADAKPITARLNYDAKKCSDCSAAEWLCKCSEEKAKKAKK